MANEFISEEVSLLAKPSPDPRCTNNGSQLTVGDMHGNALKFIYILIKHGIITHLSDEDYQTLVSIYYKDVDQLTPDDLAKFCEILDNAPVNSEGKLRLLGDELSDRGSNDYFTLKIIEKLRSKKVPIEIVLSNHAAEFIHAYETTRKFFSNVMEPHFTVSMINLQVLISRKLIARDEVIAIIKSAYKPLLKAVSYTLSEDLSSITIFSHAPIDLRAIRALAKRLSTTYEDYSPVALAKSIDNINASYQNYVDSNSIHTLYDSAVMGDGYQGRSFPSLYNPIEYIVWNRDHFHLDQPATYKGYQLVFVHGHDSEKSENANVICLDNLLGKTSALSSGIYTALYSHEIQLSPHPKFSLANHSEQREVNESIKATF